MCLGEWSPEILLLTQTPTPYIPLIFRQPFDTNGVLYYLATEEGKKPYVNPADSKVVAVQWSSIYRGKVSDFVSLRAPQSSGQFTHNYPNSFMAVDLGPRWSLVVNHYCLRNTTDLKHATKYTLTNWLLQGSNSPTHGDGGWVTLSAHENDTSLIPQIASTADWVVETPQIGYRRFRILQNGPCLGGNHHLNCGGIELYGKLYQSTAGVVSL
jgi:hypothetical protein